MTHEMKLKDAPFRRMESGEKTVELRLYDEKRQKIRVGDEIVFHHAQSGETLVRYVLRLRVFPDFASLYAALPLTKCGYTEAEAESASPADMYAYYTPEEEKCHGVLGIELCADPDVKQYMTEAEAWDYVSRGVFEKYADAFRELAKGPDWD